ncbi:restriction endonuclease [Lactiplantibacillus sp. WILCCON 0030]|uniref:Restriction endonuclease n=1 Tax=Lactiplantibacillus brownii TaxID=3069269 RepID=A0ABU1A732_9LACO|nr:restriction endonuclease [Lactiplantibacillus brownii]MDQ7936754.1 restriction endonuclease [Lactiplantibacillus brownii]
MTEQDVSWSGDISETRIREHMPEVLDILLIDRTKSTAKKDQNIIWANDNYIQFGARAYAPEAPIKPELVTGVMDSIIMPRALKSSRLQKKRTKAKAEVFTPTWIVKKQNDAVDENYAGDDLEAYMNRTWLEITCGEAPYMVSRYDMDTGDEIPLPDRVGFVDRKLRRINAEVDDQVTWQSLVEAAYKASYGFEWNGDSLLLARENLLYTYRDYFMAKWGIEPDTEQLKTVAEIISYNLFQMDGFKFAVPLSETQVKVSQQEISLFDDPEDIQEKWITKPGRRVKVMNWSKNKMEFFDKGVA